ncbi:MAG: hypothetical protein ACRDTQ_17985 [Micromonosporaceae bacterium]
MTTPDHEVMLHRWTAQLSLGQALATLSEATVVVDFPMRRPIVGRWYGDDREVIDVRSLAPRAGRVVGSVRRRTVTELLTLGASAVRAWTFHLDLHWRSGEAVWLSEHGHLDLPGAVSSIPVAERVPHRLLRRGQLIDSVPIPGWSAWGDPEVGVVWYPLDSEQLPKEPVPVLDVIDYATQIPNGPAAGAVAHLATRWEHWHAVPRAVVEAELAKQEEADAEDDMDAQDEAGPY